MYVDDNAIPKGERPRKSGTVGSALHRFKENRPLHGVADATAARTLHVGPKLKMIPFLR